LPAATDWEQTLKKAEESSSAINTWKKDLDITPEPKAEATPDAPTEAPARSINFMPTPTAAPQEAADETELLSAWLKDLEEIEAELQTTNQE
jgi:hypothetical protein